MSIRSEAPAADLPMGWAMPRPPDRPASSGTHDRQAPQDQQRHHSRPRRRPPCRRFSAPSCCRAKGRAHHQPPDRRRSRPYRFPQVSLWLCPCRSQHGWRHPDRKTAQANVRDSSTPLM